MEEGKQRRKIDEDDRRKISEALANNSHPLKEQHPHLFNICNGQVAPDSVNIQDALSIGEEQCDQFAVI